MTELELVKIEVGTLDLQVCHLMAVFLKFELSRPYLVTIAVEKSEESIIANIYQSLIIHQTMW